MQSTYRRKIKNATNREFSSHRAETCFNYNEEQFKQFIT